MFYLHQSNRLENLFDALCSVIGEPLPDPLSAEQIVVQNQGMARWLSRMIALRTGIAANIQFPLPARFMWEIYASQLDLTVEMHDFDRSVLLWRILELLPELSGKEDFQAIKGFLEDDPDGCKAYQLAERISNLFDQYLVYRPDMLLAWEAGKENDWQATLWRELAGKEKMHRARLVREFRNVHQGGIIIPDNLPDRVCLFGISSLAPAYLELLDGISGVTNIHLMHLSPCRQYWEDISSEREMARKRAAWRKRNQLDVSDYYQDGNPILASLGMVGQEFARQLAAFETHELDDYSRSDDDTLLGMLQNDILDLSDRSGIEGQLTSKNKNDRSIQFHVCHSRVREVQVLHDRLLESFELYPDLLPGEILVMAPEIEEYAPAVTAVFGAGGTEKSIPWSLADRSFRAEQSVARAFLALLDLPVSRMTATEVLSLLETPAILGRFNIQEDNLEKIRTWVRESGIRWGFDAQHRSQFNLDMSDLHSWNFGLNRLLLGYVCGKRTDLYRDISSYPHISGGDSIFLGELAKFIESLKKWHTLLAPKRKATEWSRVLQQLVEDFFAVSTDDAEEDFLIILREKVADLSNQCHLANYTDKISRGVVKEWFEQTLSAITEGQPFLSGRVTFCNMVPMRSVPFKMICLLGMNDTEYPRSQVPIPFDLMAEKPEVGDRNRRNDDCYLFLEALLSARDIFYVSWVGRDQRDNSLRPPSVVVSGLRDYISQAFTVREALIGDVLTVYHPLQPFSQKCFDGSMGTGSYAEEWLPTGISDENIFLTRPLPRPDDEMRAIDSIRLVRFWSHPVRYFLQNRLGLLLRDEDNFLEDSEPFSYDSLQRYTLVQSCISSQVAGSDPGKYFSGIKAEGKLPHGSLGENLYAECRKVAGAFVEKILPVVTEPVDPVEMNFQIGFFNLTGWLDDLYSSGHIRYRASKLHARDIVSLWVRHLLLNLVAPVECELHSLHVARDRTLRMHPVKNPAKELETLLDLYWKGLCEPLHFYPAASLAWYEALQKGKGREMAEAMRVWKGDMYRRGEGEDVAYQTAFRAVQPLDKIFESLAETVIGPILDHAEFADA